MLRNVVEHIYDQDQYGSKKDIKVHHIFLNLKKKKKQTNNIINKVKKLKSVEIYRQ